MAACFHDPVVDPPAIKQVPFGGENSHLGRCGGSRHAYKLVLPIQQRRKAIGVFTSVFCGFGWQKVWLDINGIAAHPTLTIGLCDATHFRRKSVGHRAIVLNEEEHGSRLARIREGAVLISIHSVDRYLACLRGAREDGDKRQQGGRFHPTSYTRTARYAKASNDFEGGFTRAGPVYPWPAHACVPPKNRSEIGMTPPPGCIGNEIFLILELRLYEYRSFVHGSAVSEYPRSSQNPRRFSARKVMALMNLALFHA